MTRDCHIITVEDPIEYYHSPKKSVISQREVHVDVPTFSEGIIRALRQDPDVILVGEMRDLTTISAAITAAETGHLVFGTLHTSGAASTINRVIDAFPTDQQEQVRVQLAGNLIAVLSQALCPRIDTDGMLAAYEFMYVTPGIQNLIRENKSFRIDSEIQTGKRYGMQLLDDNLWMHFTAGRISPEEAIDKSKNPGYMVDKMQKNGFQVDVQDDALMAEVEDGGGDAAGSGNGAKLKPNGGAGGGGAAANAEAEKQAQIAANRARMQAQNQKR
jgi:twitching motility protein PilT